MSELLTINVQVSLEDYQKFSKALLMDSLKKKKFQFILIGAGAILFLGIQIFRFIAAIQSSTIDSNYMEFPYTIGFVIFLVCFLFVFVRLFKNSDKTAKKYYETNKLLKKPTTYVISDECIETKSESTQSKIKWDELYKIQKIESMGYALFIAKAQAYLIPESSFVNDEEKKTFEAIIASKHINNTK